MSLQFVQELSPDSAGTVHHMVVYLCDGLNFTGSEDVGESFECDELSRNIVPCRFGVVIGGWAIGGAVRH